jgi:low affinity Fe/Cu permease
LRVGGIGRRVRRKNGKGRGRNMVSKASWFTHFAQAASHITGRPLAFIAAVAVIVVWAVTGPVFGFSDTWQLVINTGTTIVTFLMVFVIQNTQNRDTAAIHIKLDELIRVTQRARNVVLDLEELDDKDLEGLRQDYERLAEEGRARRHERSPRAAAKPRKPAKSGGRKRD